MLVFHLNQTDLAFRWRISPRTLERWRFTKSGPSYPKIGGRVVYRLEDIEDKSKVLRSSATICLLAESLLDLSCWAVSFFESSPIEETGQSV